ncbi:MAG TPA: YafY family protein [Flavobacterium sp.]|nr:YafY family protein [Flavobacterium sp.]
MNRFDRITAILIQLQSKKIVKAQDLADRFDISLRTVYRDIRSLEEAGVPLYGEAGIGYSLVDGYRLPPVMFTREEAMTFVTAEKLMEQFTDVATKASYQSAMYKMKAVLRSDEKDMVENIEDSILIRKRARENPDAPDNILDCLLQSISENRIAKMTYNAFSSSEATERTIEPIGIYHENQLWYVIGWCHLRKGYRHFRTDRISEINITDEKYHKKHLPFKDYLLQAESTQNLETVKILVNKKIAPYINNQKYYYGFVSEIDREDQIEMTFRTLYIEGFARWMLMFADQADIIEPLHMKVQMRELIDGISKKL